MVAVKSWDKFQQETIKLYESNSTKTRYSVKFRAIDGKLTLKITDDVHVFKHTTSSSITLNRFTALNTLLFEKMAGTSLAPPPPPPVPSSKAAAAGEGPSGSGSAGATTPAADAMDGVEPAPTAEATSAGGAPGAGAKKKKKGKGKK